MNIQENYLQRIQYELAHTPAEYLPALLNIINSFRKSICINSAAESFVLVGRRCCKVSMNLSIAYGMIWTSECEYLLHARF
ncbi:hypothetical protein [Desulfamplus magnetovallimortis]|uniref:hypothetical protein n=1 Tax=Desulfamplus magnetovallimortis TaxID=1246637 RepID=UPI001644DE66|nr:hypothetical protein [Desulfamplus magnetovallimortis]